MSSALRLRKSSAVVLAVTSLLGLVAFTWPLFVDPVGSENAAHSGDAPWVFLALLPLLFAVIVAGGPEDLFRTMERSLEKVVNWVSQMTS